MSAVAIRKSVARTVIVGGLSTVSLIRSTLKIVAASSSGLVSITTPRQVVLTISVACVSVVQIIRYGWTSAAKSIESWTMSIIGSETWTERGKEADAWTEKPSAEEIWTEKPKNSEPWS